MSEKEQRERHLPPNFVVYRHDNPSPVFSKQWVEYIDSISKDFSGNDLERIRSFERFTFNLNTGFVGNSGIPGLREDKGKAHIYVKRFSDKPWEEYVELFYSQIPSSFPDKVRCTIDMLKLSLPSGEIFYPFSLLGDLTGWRTAMQTAAGVCGTLLAEFKTGKFITSDGRSFPISQLRMEWNPPGKPTPASW